MDRTAAIRGRDAFLAWLFHLPIDPVTDSQDNLQETQKPFESIRTSMAKLFQLQPHDAPVLKQHDHTHAKTQQQMKRKQRGHVPTRQYSGAGSLVSQFIHGIIICYWFVIFFLSYQSPDLRDYYQHETLLGQPPSKAVFSTEHSTWTMDRDRTTSSWQSQHGIVQVLQMRFMQFQPHLKDLAKARLELFRGLTLPSLKKQSNKDFLLILRTDPNLDADILHELQLEVASMDNAILVASNEDVRDFRQTSRNEIEQWHETKAILAGSKERLWSYHQAAQHRPVLETRLDADDALAVDFVHSIQSRAAHVIQQEQTQDGHDSEGATDSSSSWRVFCAFEALEWQLNVPSAAEQQMQGHCVELQRPPIDSQLRPPQNGGGAVCKARQPYCFTPGLTYLYNTNTKEADFPTHQHQEIGVLIPECDETKHKHNCLETFGGSKQFTSTGVLRARTPTSAGMDRVSIATKTTTASKLPKRRDEETQDAIRKKKQSDMAWRQMEYVFGVQSQRLVQTRAHLLDNLAAIVKDALAGQCSHRHSCKASAEKRLKQILALYNKQQQHAEQPQLQQ